MDKILLALDATSLNMNAVDFACYIARLTHSKLTGVFLENSVANELSAREILYAAPFVEAVTSVDQTNWKDKAVVFEQNITAFKEACLNRGVNCLVHRDRDVPEYEMIYESRFADLLILDGKTSFAGNIEVAPSPFVKSVLAKSECPVIIAPENFFTIDELVFSYDGSLSSVFAIKQFTYLLPQLDDIPVTVLQVNKWDDCAIEERKQIGELLQPHYSSINYKTVNGKVSEEILQYLNQKKNALVVMGSFGRSNISNFFKPSTAELILRSVNLPVFIAHSN